MQSTTITSSDDSIYACPVSGCPLLLDGTAFRSAKGDRGYQVCDGIPMFLAHNPAETPGTASRLQRLNQVARTLGWLAALQQVMPGDNSYVTDTGRAAFLDLLPLSPENTVLEIGPALGLFTPLIARRAKFVHALEVVPGQAAFTAERCRQSGVSNVRVACGGDDCRLPFQTDSFDLVICNLVFEWCAWRESGDPQTAQQRFLGEMHRVLKVGGSLYLATKNRFALRYLLGKSDEHVGHMRFGNALPRWLMKLAARLTHRPKPQAMLYSHRRLRRMLQHKGFADIRAFWAAPEFRFPKHMVSLDADAVRAARATPEFQQGDSRSNRLLMPLIPAALVRHFTPGHAFLARKPACK